MILSYFEGCATLDEAKKRYHQLALKFHPDKGGKKEDFQELLNQFHVFKPQSEKFKGEAESWNSKQYAELINQLLNITGIEIIVCGSWVWLEGNTKPVKEQIKAVPTGDLMNRGFSKSKQQWYFSPRGYRKKSKEELSFNEITSLYGAERIKREPVREEEKLRLIA